MKIIDILSKKQSLSFEFFPPKQIEQEELLYSTVDHLSKYFPDFVSITYGAGGSTNKQTFRWTTDILRNYGINTMMHFTCYGNDKNSVKIVCDKLKDNHIDNVLVLRGDKPKNGCDCQQLYFKHAHELVEFIHNKYPELCIGVAGYPEKHSEALSIDDDIINLKRKLDAGGNFIITQLFFENKFFFKYLDLLHKYKIDKPVIAGIMPITAYSQIQRFTDMCGVTIPGDIVSKLENSSELDSIKIGEDFAYRQALELIENGVNGVHFYTLNKYHTVSSIVNKLKEKISFSS